MNKSICNLLLFFLFVIGMIVFFGCETPRGQYNRERKELKVTKGLGDDYFYIIDIMDCNYIIYHGNNKGTIVHAANCQNHKRIDPTHKPVEWSSGSEIYHDTFVYDSTKAPNTTWIRPYPKATDTGCGLGIFYNQTTGKITSISYKGKTYIPK